MGCFFGCFRVNDNRRTSVHLLSQPISSNHKVPVEAVARNPLSSLLLLESEDKNQSSQKERNCSTLGSNAPDVDFNELQAEAKFLKACGTLPHTPVEIRKIKKLTDLESGYGDRESSTSYSWLQNAASIEKVKLETQPDHKLSPVKLYEEWDNGSDYSSHSPDSCLTGQNTERNYYSSGVRHNVETSQAHADVTQNPISSSTPHVLSMQCKNKPVRFDCEFDPSSYSVSNASSIVTCEEKKPSAGENSVSKPSPYPTPLESTNDIQTPDTFFPTGKSPRIRSQYVHPGLNPVENADQLKQLITKSFGFDDYSVQLKEQIEEGANTVEKELTLDTSLSSWLPPKQAHQGHNGHNNRSFIGKTPKDRPIIGMVAAHWNDDETVSSQPKWWDGNGIPNSTNKYKEDQKVSWHATPFEERLEKALSEDKLTGDRKQFGKMSLPPPIDC